MTQKTCGKMRLQLIMVQYAQAYGPNARLANANCSYSTWLYQAIKNSVM